MIQAKQKILGTRLVLLGILGLLLVVGSVFFGEYRVSWVDFVDTLSGKPPAPMTEFFVLQRRLPRALVAFATGVCLAAAGSLIQQLLKNPLASPDIIGITNTASLGGALVILLWGGTTATAWTGALAGAAIALGFLFMAQKLFNVTGAKLILLGVGLAAISTALINYLLTIVFVPSAVVAQSWLVGTLQGRGWAELPLLSFGVLVLVAVHVFFAKDLKILDMGDDTAGGLGINVPRLRTTLLAAAALLTAIAVLSAGPIGFVALVAPHIATALTGSKNLIGAALCGGILLSASDLIAQYALPVAVPVGVITIIGGGGFFLWLLFGKGRIRG
ncbi:FecCD family ABC transporter permease [Glutamicibacter sp. NPDC087344]|uniref:FecCD family ABC transporter permease n=1 Tax=Glutamicibacter sp. NPDC087344 TaxID=3363994 RepID=UPI00380E6ABA